MLSISPRTARLNQDYKGKSKEKDGEVTKLLTFGLDEIELEDSEWAAITGEPHVARALIDNSKNGRRPALKCFSSFTFDEVIENASVVVTLRGGTERRFIACRVFSIGFHVSEQGVPVMSCKVLTAPSLDAGHGEFMAEMGEHVTVELHGATKTDQQEMPLNRAGTGEAPEAGAKPRGRGRPRKGEVRVN